MFTKSSRFLWSIFFLLVFALNAASQPTPATSAEKTKLPPANWIRPRQIDIKHVALDLRFDWQKKQAYGTATITFAPLNATNKISLDAGNLTINSITLANGKALQFTYDGGDKNDGLVIVLDRVYPPDSDVTIKIDYHTNWINQTDPNNLWGSFGKGLRFLAPTANDPNMPRQIWSYGEPAGNRYWFPSYDAPNDFRTSEFTATVDKTLKAISNGTLVETKDNPDGTRTFHWKMATPHANYLTSFVVGEYVDVPQNFADIPLHNFGFPHEKEAVAASVVRLPDMMKFYSDVTGLKYPFPSYSQIFVADFGGGMEHITASTLTENLVDDDRTHADYFYLWDGLEAHELAHQWFGNYLTCRDWGQIWLNESFAHYFDALYNEYKNGHEEFLLWNVLADHNTYLADWNAGIRRPVISRHYANAEEFTAGTYPNQRGAQVLHMLRKHLGEENWWKAIRHYVKTNANQSVVTEDFRQAIEETTGEPMDWFFAQWLYNMGHPVFAITKNYDAAKKQLSLTVQQTQKIDPNNEYPQTEFFTGKVAIEIDERIEHVWLAPKAENRFTFACNEQPKLVNFDYESTWIAEIHFEKSGDELLYQLAHDRDILGKNWALGELVKLARSDKTPALMKNKIYDGLRQAIMSNAYWRFRLNATQQLRGLLAPATTIKPVALDNATIATLLTTIKNEKSWSRAAAISFLGMTREPKFTDLYLHYFNDESDRVINAAAIALGKCKSPRAFDALAKLVSKPSWKNQSLMSALAGLKELGDPRGFDIAFQALSDLQLYRWRLPNPPIWDLRVFAAETIAALGKSEAAYPMIFVRLKKALAENDTSGVFNNALLTAILADPRGQEVFELLNKRYKEDANAMQAVAQYEAQFKAAIKNKAK